MDRTTDNSGIDEPAPIQPEPDELDDMPAAPDAEPFAVALRPERIDPKHLVDGRPPELEARLTHIDASARRQGPRRYAVSGLAETVRVDLWNGDPADDADRVRAAVEDALAPAPEAAEPKGY